MSLKRLEPAFIDEFPTSMEPGLLYVSIEYRTTGHLCACGCGYEVVLPLSPALWSFSFDGEDVSLWPSVGSWALPCQSHYVIDRGRVKWRRAFTPEEIARNRKHDRAAMREFEGPGTSQASPSTNREITEDQENPDRLDQSPASFASGRRLTAWARRGLALLTGQPKK